MATASENRETALLAALIQVADTLVADFDMLDLLHTLTTDCVALFPADAAGLLIAAHRDTLQLVASSSEAARLIELFQLQSDEGPCLDCYRSGQPVNAPDLTAGDTWPRFTARAAEQGFRSVHAVPMRLRGHTIGALNLFGAAAGALPPADLRAVQALADAATISILQERDAHTQHTVTSRLQTALNSRAIIEQAKGVLAEVGHLDMGEAFIRLRDHAHATDQPLTELARRLVTREAGTEVLDQTSP
ncbi:GAF and ANTAR domain-containing protein [Actinomycetospora sp.]|jgi:GAF domain-containing protein|uniref:GAF and ANTAR domain-containing protein n=1 Tax=Actinomycetospora sp. TaxID=1872135 RepID=UPI002F40D2C3